MSLAHVEDHYPLLDKDKDKDNDKHKDKENDKDKVLKRPITCYVFEKQGVQGYQIRRLQ